MYEQESPRLSRSGYLRTSSAACHGLLIITVITPLPTESPARQKCQRTMKLANAAITDMQMRPLLMVLRSMQNFEGVS